MLRVIKVVIYYMACVRFKLYEYYERLFTNLKPLIEFTNIHLQEW